MSKWSLEKCKQATMVGKIKNMLESGKTTSEIAEFLEIPEEKVKEVKELIDKYGTR